MEDFGDEGGADKDIFKALAEAYLRGVKEARGEGAGAILCVSGADPMTFYLQSADAGVVDRAGKDICGLLGGKGGGKKVSGA